jgi:hypothetical protein
MIKEREKKGAVHVIVCVEMILQLSQLLTYYHMKLYSSLTQWGYIIHKPNDQSIRSCVHSSLLINIDVPVLCPIFWQIKDGHTHIHGHM